MQALRRLLDEASAQQRADPGRCLARQGLPVGFVLHDGRDDVGERLAVERLFARQHLVQHAAECPDVAPLVHRFAARLFGTHVRRGPQQHPRHRPCVSHRRRLRHIDGWGVVAQAFRQTEVENLHFSGRRDDDVGRLEIAVNDSFVVCRLKGIAGLNGEIHEFGNRDRLAGDALI